jgi:tripartite-type tricarboxylate transporter receptor subunit TctC
MIERERTMRTANAPILGVLIAAAACSALSVAWRASWSDQPAKLVVPFGSGGNTNLVARIAAQRLTVTTGQNLIGALVAEFVARAAPNGEAVFIGATPQISILPHLDRRDSRPIP